MANKKPTNKLEAAYQKESQALLTGMTEALNRNLKKHEQTEEVLKRMGWTQKRFDIWIDPLTQNEYDVMSAYEIHLYRTET